MFWEGLNRRRFPRIIYPCLIKIVCRDGQEETVLTHTENIGVGGICVILRRDIKLFSPVGVEIDLIDLTDHLGARGKVVWVARRKAIEPVKPLFYDVGIEFSEISDQHRATLSSTIDQMIKKGTKVLKPMC